jgi:hypothetical protein
MGIPLNPGQQVVNLHVDMGGSKEQSYATVAAGTGSFETFTATFGAFASCGQGDYLAFSQPGGETFAVWLDKDANGTTPSGAVYTAADNKIEVDIVTGNTATQVAAAVKAAIELDADFDEYTISADAGVLTFTANTLGNPTNAAPHNTGDTGDGSITVSATSGSAATSQNTYLVLRDDDTGLFHVWFNVNSEGVDPNPGGGSVGIEVAVDAAATDAQAATAMASAIDAHAEFEAEADGARVKITTATKAVVTDIGAGDSGFTVSVSTQGQVSRYDANGSPTDISNNPSAF